MAAKLLITPNTGSTTAGSDPRIQFQGTGNSTDITLRTTTDGSLSFEGTAGQLFSITDTMVGTIFSANDVSGIPSIEVLDTGLVKFAQYSGNVVIGSATDDGNKFQLNGTMSLSGNVTAKNNTKITFGPNSTWASYLYIGGDGRNGVTSTPTLASVATTNGNLHLDSGSDKAMYLNYYSGTGGVQFGNGASGIVASVSAGGVFTGTNFSGPGTGLTGTAASLTAGAATTATNFNNGTSYSSGGGIWVDVVNSAVSTDWLELCYSSGVGVRIGTGANGTLPLYASALYDAGNRVYSASSRPTTLSGYGITDWRWGNFGDINTNPGYSGSFYFTSASGTPIPGQTDGMVLHHAYPAAPTTWGSQLVQNYRDGRIYVRGLNSGSFSTWLTVLDSGNSPNALGLNQNVNTGGSPTFVDIYASTGWFRNNTANLGLFNTTSGNHFYSGPSNYWNLTAGGRTAGGIQLRLSHETTIQGYLYFDTSGFGLLHSGGGWAVQIAPGGGTGTLYGNWGSTGTFSATTFSGAGTNLTGTASSLTVGNANNAYNFSGSGSIYGTAAGQGYSTYPQIREKNIGGAQGGYQDYGPGLAFHWGGVVASSIQMEISGRIVIRNNPGTAYEAFGCAALSATTGNFSGNVTAPNFVGTASTVTINYNDDSNSSYQMLWGSGNSVYGTAGITCNPALDTITCSGLNINGVALFGNYGQGMVGVYSATNYQAVFSMGTSYQPSADGTSLSNHYGIAWTHSNIGGQSVSGLQHQALFTIAGATQTAIGVGIYTVGNISQAATAYMYPGFQSGQGTGRNLSYYLAASTSWGLYSNTSINAQGVYDSGNRVYSALNLQTNVSGSSGSCTGNAATATNVGGLVSNTYTSYTGSATTVATGGYYGLLCGSTTSHSQIMYDGSGNGGLYRQASGWQLYYLVANGSVGIMSSTTSASYALYVTGAMYATGNVVAYSDERSKKNIVTIDNALEKTMKLRGVYYHRKDESDLKDVEQHGKRQVGVIAQETNEVLPEAVTYDKENDKYGVSYGNVVGLLIEAIKEQQGQIDALKEKINSLTTN